MTVEFETIDDSERFEEAENVIEDGYEIYRLKGDEGAFIVSVYGLQGVLSTAHNDKHREELRWRVLTRIYETVMRDGVYSGVIEASYTFLAEIVSMNMDEE